MRVLVAVASKHGSTTEIGAHIAARLRAEGHAVDEVAADASRWLDDEHDAYVIGSAVYAGNWLRSARRFLRDNATVLAGQPVWLFSSGPLGDDPAVGMTGGHITELCELVHAREHRTFRGRLREADLGRAERLVVKAVRAPYGDFRDWDAVARWTDGIVDSLAASTPRVVPGATGVAAP